MESSLEKIILKIKLDGKDYSDFRVLLAEIEKSGISIPKDELSEFLNNDYRIQLHTTSNELAKLISELAKDLNANNALDVCCGTGNILYFLQNYIDDLTGIEIKEDIAVLTKHYMPDLKIITADTFLYPFSETYDLIVGNLPWGPPVIYNGQNTSLEEAFLRRAFDLCNQNGDIVVIVPYNILNGSSFQKLRQDFKHNLKTIIGFPSGLVRHSGIKTALLHLRKDGSDSLKIGHVENVQDLKKPLTNILTSEVTISDVEDRWDPLYYEKGAEINEKLSQHDSKALFELAEIINGRQINKEYLLDKGELLYLKPSNIHNGELKISESSKFLLSENIIGNHKAAIAQPDDIIISTIFNTLKLYIVKKEDPPILVSNNMAIIRSSYDDYILSFLKSEQGIELFTKQAERLRKGAVIPHVTLKDLKGIKIPILPLSNLNMAGDKAIEKASKSELEGLKLLLENYRKENAELKSENAELKSKDAFAENRLLKIEKHLELLHQKMDTLLDLVKDLTMDFRKIKNLPREEEEKLFKLCLSIDKKMATALNEQSTSIENYIEETKRWLDLWELLNDDSKKFLPIAELIFDELSQLKEPDFSPFIVQYCRAFENEILKKLFETYHREGLLNVDVNDLIKDDLANLKSGKFAKMLKQNKQTYTLGDMNFIMSLLKSNGNTLKQSKLLQHFRHFVLQYFNDNILEKTFLTDLNNITSNFRNKAAHPYLLNLTIALECKKLIRKNLNLFLEAKK